MASSPTPTSVASSLALLGGTPVGEVTYSKFPIFNDRAIARVEQVLREGKAVGLGRFHSPEIAEAEETISRYHGGREVLACSSGHAALQGALAGLEICAGDEVITTPYTWGASTSCILHQNAVPIFVDVLRDTGLIDPDKIEAAITPRTKAILAVHLYGQPANLRRLREIADRHDLKLIEDGSQAHGAEIDGMRVGEVGDAAGFSCMGGKVLPTTEAGYLVTPDKSVFWKASMIGQHMGRSPEADFPDDLRPWVDSLVYTYRVTPLNAVLLTEQFGNLGGWIAERRRHAARLRERIAGARFVRLPNYETGVKPVYHLCSMTFDADAAGVTRDTFVAALKAEGLLAFGYVPSPIPDWPRLHWQDYRGPRVAWASTLEAAGVDYRNMDLPNCRWRVAHAIETRFDFVDPQDDSVDRMAEIILKVESQIEALREHEHRHGSADSARR
ncbi:DegT/DnrJ/EryC1/StrS family aminotransferase [Synoicihabitans lomoniglobus]|uniref:DegT/DnrJ/EryC1/StrS family aminotransferase n=1 Tax=Synoicihabitans lomoniglobus TaxID=2909285 RepID=A0AAF0CPU2_9BACT|nr:DegT/DnrJ/EryC1/StrS family aminotransferase [Opitutaceae bacterium LMO-M01]WED65846.1 DegT/DnrJ/EryC1/StrS family aminotransferase [Opitutaceae bacterium LMO-M01]